MLVEWHTNTIPTQKCVSRDIVVKVEDSIVISITKSINELRDETLSLKNIVIKRLQEQNEKLNDKYNRLEKRFIFLKKILLLLTSMEREIIVFTGITDNVQDHHLEEISILLTSMEREIIQFLLALKTMYRMTSWTRLLNLFYLILMSI